MRLRDGKVVLRARGRENSNMEEMRKFMAKQKRLAIISEASSSGFSLHSLKGRIKRRRRVMITMELPWSADKAVQQLGRTHRSNQRKAPKYAPPRSSRAVVHS